MSLKSKEATRYYSLDSSEALIKQQVTSWAEIWECSRTGARSLHSSIEILPDQVICSMGAREYLASPNYLTVQIDDEKHIMLDPSFLQYINHSCSPNVFFDTEKMRVICIKAIAPGEAITFFYPSTEWSMKQRFRCLCGSQNCLTQIQGARFLSSDILQSYRLTEYIQSKRKKYRELA